MTAREFMAARVIPSNPSILYPTDDESAHFVFYGSAKFTAHLFTYCLVLTHCGVVTPYGDIDLCQHWFIGSGNGLLPESAKPLPELVLTYGN